jgi:DNA-binding beta-propeller fold protein YncE
MPASTRLETQTVGAGSFRYRPVPGWEQLPEGWSFVEAVGAATDSQDRVYVFNRGEHPVIVFDDSGRFLRAWGQGVFRRPHGIWIGPDDSLYLADDWDHTVRKFTPEGRLLLTLGTSGQASDSGIEGIDYRTIRRAAPPFNLPTNLALAPDGAMYVTDGYGNARVHRFAPDGALLFSWGEPGDGPGQFNLPHGIGVDSRGRVYVADRENSRVQRFSAEGRFLDQWTDVVRPCEVFVDPRDNVFVAELGRRVGGFPWMTPDPAASGGRVSIFDSEGNLLSRFGGGDHPGTPGDFLAPHDIWVDRQGSIYTSEVVVSAAGKTSYYSPQCPTLQKFVPA